MKDYTVWDNEYVMFYLSHVQRERFDDLLTEYMDDPTSRPNT